MDVELSLDKDGNSRGFAVVEYQHPVEAVQAISMLDHQLLYDRRMTVRMDKITKEKLPDGLGGIGRLNMFHINLHCFYFVWPSSTEQNQSRTRISLVSTMLKILDKHFHFRFQLRLGKLMVLLNVLSSRLLSVSLSLNLILFLILLYIFSSPFLSFSLSRIAHIRYGLGPKWWTIA